MTNAVDIHAKSRARDEARIVESCAKRFLGDSSIRLRASRDHERLFVLADERLVKMDLAPTDVATEHVQGPMIMGEFPDAGLVADLAAPCRVVGQSFGKLQTINTSTDLSKLKRPAGVAPGATPTRFNPRVTTTKFSALEHAYDVSVPPEVMQNADRDLGEALGVFAREVWRLQREMRAATLLTTSGNWGSNTVVGSTWSSSGNPVNDLFKALAISANPRPNILLMPEAVSQYWFDNTHVQSFCQTHGPERLGLSIVVGATKSKVGGVLKDVWATGTNGAILLRTGGLTGDLDEVELTTAATTRWFPKIEGTIPKDERWIMSEGVLLRTFWDRYTAARGICAGVLVVNEDIVMVDSTLCCLITGVA